MTQSELSTLKDGDLIVHAPTGRAFVVAYCRFEPDGTPRILAMRTVEVSNSDEWNKVCRCCGNAQST